MPWLHRLAYWAMLLAVAVGSFLVAVPGTGCLLCLGWEHLEARSALREADAFERAGEPDMAEGRREYAAERRQLAWENYVAGGTFMLALIGVAGGFGIGLARGRRGAGEAVPGSSDRRARARRVQAGLLAAILVGMGLGVLAYFGLLYLFVFVLDD